MKRRVAVTGLGAVSAAGAGAKALWQALRDGRSGIGAIPPLTASAGACDLAAQVPDFHARDFMRPKAAATLARFTQLGVAAARLAHEDGGGGALPATRVGACFGTSTSAVREFQAAVEQHSMDPRLFSPSPVLESIGVALTNHVAQELEVRGPTMTLGSGCAAGIDVIQWGCEQIRSRRVVAVLAGASDSPMASCIYAAWSALGLLSRWPGSPATALRPFDALSDGTVLGEAAGVVLLEDLEHARARGARVYAEILGYGSGSDGLHRPGDETSASLEMAVRRALQAADLDPRTIDHVSTHGAGVPANDRAESSTYRTVFGRHADNLTVTSVKPATGNPFAAGGALQVIATCLAMEEQFLTPTMNLEIPAEGCDLDYVAGRGRVARIDRALVATRAIGANYSAVVLGRDGAAGGPPSWT
jgi:3-oxoacyl-[acyl-carrier-protein] synthase II